LQTEVSVEADAGCIGGKRSGRYQKQSPPDFYVGRALIFRYRN
jgi:hypothetical protein